MAESIRVGYIVPLTGVFGLDAQEQVRGGKLAIEEFNREGGLEGRMAELLVRDNETKADMAALKAEELIDKDKVHFIVGSLGSPDMMAINGVCGKRGVLFSGISVSDAILEKPNRNPYTFHEGVNAHMAFGAVARYAFGHFGRRIAMLSQNVPTMAKYGVEAMLNLAKQIDVEIVYNVIHQAGSFEDFRPHLLEIEKTKPDVLFLNNFGFDQSNSLAQALELGLREKMKVVCPFFSERQRAKDGPDSFEGVIGGISYDWQLQDKFATAKAFNASHAKAFDGMLPTSYTAYGYVAVKVILETARKINSLEPEALANALLDARFDYCKGPQYYRRLDHQSVMPYLVIQSKGKDEMQNPNDFYKILHFADFLGPRAFHVSRETE